MKMDLMKDIAIQDWTKVGLGLEKNGCDSNLVGHSGIFDLNSDYLRIIEKVTKENTERIISLIKEQSEYIRNNKIDTSNFNGFEISNFDGEISVNVSINVEENDKIARELGWTSEPEDDADVACRKSVDCPTRFSPENEDSSPEWNRDLDGYPKRNTESEEEEVSKDEEQSLEIYSTKVTDDSTKSPVDSSCKPNEEDPETLKNATADVQESSTTPVVLRSYSRRKKVTEEKTEGGEEDEELEERGESSVETNPEVTEIRHEDEDGEPLFVISCVMGNVPFDFEEDSEKIQVVEETVPEDWNADETVSATTSKKTDDITKIKGWRRKQFSTTGRTDSDSEPSAEESNVGQDKVVDSAFVCDSLDDFLDKEADLKIDYEIPHLYAEVGIKLTSDEIVSRPKVSEPEFPHLKSVLLAPSKDRKPAYQTRKTNGEKMTKEKCLQDWRYNYVANGGKLIKISGSYDSRPTKPNGNNGGNPCKPEESWANRNKSIDDIFDDLMEKNLLKQHRASDKSIVLLYDKKYSTVDLDSPGEKTEDSARFYSNLRNEPGKVETTKVEKENCRTEIKSKLMGLSIYPGPFDPLKPIVQFHLNKIRSYRTKVDRNWANFSVSALCSPDNLIRRQRMIVPVICPFVYDENLQLIEEFKNSDYYKNLECIEPSVESVSDQVVRLVNALKESVCTKLNREEKEKNQAKVLERLKKNLGSQIVSREEKRTRKLPERYKDTTILKEKERRTEREGSSSKNGEISSPSVTSQDVARRSFSRRFSEKYKSLKSIYELKECKVVMDRMEGLSRVAPWCLLHHCYNCQQCRLRNPFSSKFFRFPSKKRRPSVGSLDDRNVARKRSRGFLSKLSFHNEDLFSARSRGTDDDVPHRNYSAGYKMASSEKAKEFEKKQKRSEPLFSIASSESEENSSEQLKRLSFNKKLTKLLAEKLREVKSNLKVSGGGTGIENLRTLRTDAIELIKLNAVKEYFAEGQLNIWYLKPEGNNKSRAFVNFSSVPPLEGAVHVKASPLCENEQLPKVISEIILDDARFDPNDYAILHCDGSLWEIHGSVNFTAERSEEVEKAEIIFADDAIDAGLKPLTRLKSKMSIGPAKWWLMDLCQDYHMIRTESGDCFFKNDILRCMRANSTRFLNIKGNTDKFFGICLIPKLFPYGLVGPFRFEDHHHLQLKSFSCLVPFVYCAPEVGPEESDNPLKTVIGSVINDARINSKEITGIWLHDRQDSYLEVFSRVKKFSSHPRKGFEYNLENEHDYSIASKGTLPKSNDSSSTHNRFGRGEVPGRAIYLVPDIPNVGYVKGNVMPDGSVTLKHPIVEHNCINVESPREWLNNFLRKKVQFIPKDLEIDWKIVKSAEEVADLKPINKFHLGGTHILCRKGLFYMLSMNKSVLDELGVDKSCVLKAISDSSIIKEVMEVKELGKLVTNKPECDLPIPDVLRLAIEEIKELENKNAELVCVKAAAEKQKWKLCRQYMEALNSCDLHGRVKKILFGNVKRQMLAVQAAGRDLEPRKTKTAAVEDWDSPEKESPKPKETNFPSKRPRPIQEIQMKDGASIIKQKETVKNLLQKEDFRELADANISKLESKLKRIYDLLGRKEVCEDRSEYERLSARLEVISNHLIKIKSVFDEKGKKATEEVRLEKSFGERVEKKSRVEEVITLDDEVAVIQTKRNNLPFPIDRNQTEEVSIGKQVAQVPETNVPVDSGTGQSVYVFLPSGNRKLVLLKNSDPIQPVKKSGGFIPITSTNLTPNVSVRYQNCAEIEEEQILLPARQLPVNDLQVQILVDDQERNRDRFQVVGTLKPSLVREPEGKRKSDRPNGNVTLKKMRTTPTQFVRLEEASIVSEVEDEASWLTMNTEDIEKNFQKLIEPIISNDSSN